MSSASFSSLVSTPSAFFSSILMLKTLSTVSKTLSFPIVIVQGIDPCLSSSKQPSYSIWKSCLQRTEWYVQFIK